jgi:hypothetical protein
MNPYTYYVQDLQIISKEPISMNSIEEGILYEVSFNLLGEVPNIRVNITETSEKMTIDWLGLDTILDETDFKSGLLSRYIWHEFIRKINEAYNKEQNG